MLNLHLHIDFELLALAGWERTPNVKVVFVIVAVFIAAFTNSVC